MSFDFYIALMHILLSSDMELINALKNTKLNQLLEDCYAKFF